MNCKELHYNKYNTVVVRIVPIPIVFSMRNSKPT